MQKLWENGANRDRFVDQVTKPLRILLPTLTWWEQIHHTMSNIKIPKLNIGGKKQTTARRTNRSTRRSNMQSNRSTMSVSRREKLLSIQKREKLKALLVRKFRMQYGTSKAMDKVILKAIDGFVKRQRVTEVDLDNLGKTIAAAAKQLGKTPVNNNNNNPSSSTSTNGVPSSSRMSHSMSTGMNSDGMDSNRGGPQLATLNPSASAPVFNKTPKLAPIARTPQSKRKQTPQGEEVPEDWSLIFRYQQKKQAEEAQQEMQAKKQERGGTLASLKALTDAKNKRKYKAKKLDLDYSASVQENMKKWKLEEDEKRASLSLIIKKQSVQRQAQMEDRKRRAAEEKKQKLKYEMNLMKRLNRETQQQEEREKLKKINDKKRLVVFLAGNAQHKKQKDDIVRKEREDDVQRMKEYAAMLKKQEEARSAFFAGVSAKMDNNAANNEHAKQEEYAATKKRELRDLRFQKEKDDAIVEEQRKKAAWRKKNQTDINKWLNNSIQAKQQEREKEKSMYIEINNYAKQKAAEAKEQEADERRKRRAFQKKYKEELAAQVQGREHLYHYVGRVKKRKYASMSDREKALNKSLIKKIREEAPELLV